VLPVVIVLAVLLVVSVLGATSVGSGKIAPQKIARAIIPFAFPAVSAPESNLPENNISESDSLGERKLSEKEIASLVWELRLPRIMLAALVGAALSLAGAALQGMIGNPLADPYTIGVSSGAAVGAGLALLLGFAGAANGFALPAMAFVCALLALALVFALARTRGTLHTSGFLLAGIVTGSFLWAVLTLLLSLAKSEQRAILSWLMGRFDQAEWAQVALLAGLVGTAGVALWVSGRGLDAFAFGEEVARSVGVDVEKFKAGTLTLCALLTAGAVAFSGIIGFVGLVVPHLSRFLVGPPHRALLPVSALLGAILTVCADLLARTVRTGEELPVGVVTALLGAPFFLILLRRQAGE
jgi:iron complex transport system permease protein